MQTSLYHVFISGNNFWGTSWSESVRIDRQTVDYSKRKTPCRQAKKMSLGPNVTRCSSMSAKNFPGCALNINDTSNGTNEGYGPGQAPLFPIDLMAAVIGIFNNDGVLLVFMKNPPLRKAPFNVYLMNLLIANFGVSCLQYTPSAVTDYWNMYWSMGDGGCTWFIYVVNIAGVGRSTHLLWSDLTIERPSHWFWLVSKISITTTTWVSLWHQNMAGLRNWHASQVSKNLEIEFTTC